MAKNATRIVVVLVIICILATLITFIGRLSSATNYERSEIDTLYELEHNNEFIIKERWFSLGKCYDIFVVKSGKDVKIGEIRGKILYLFGDVFTFYDMNENIIAYEEEVYKLFKVTRSAKVYNGNGHQLLLSSFSRVQPCATP